MAKKSGVKVIEFSIGFGKSFFSKQKGETTYSIRMIPLGGYVRMLGEEEASEDERAFNNIPAWKRLLIVLAGPAINIAFGIVLFWLLASIYSKNMYTGLVITKNYLVLLFQGIAKLFTGGAQNADLVGPVGISQIIVNTSGLFDFFYLLSVISISLGITNLLPIPGLDGGKILILIIELIRKKKLSEDLDLKLTAFRNVITFNSCCFCYR